MINYKQSKIIPSQKISLKIIKFIRRNFYPSNKLYKIALMIKLIMLYAKMS